MKMQLIISMLLCSLLILCSFSSSIPSTISSISPDWPDGTFQGEWRKQNENKSGFIWGTLNQGRRPTIGTFNGNWNTTDKTEKGTFNGIFYGVIVIGQWNSSETIESNRAFGILKLNETHFSLKLIITKTGLLDLSGTHDTSFLPKTTGLYDVGVKTMHLIDTSRPENFTQDPTDFREMMIELWYPIEKNNIGTKTEYMDYLEDPGAAW